MSILDQSTKQSQAHLEATIHMLGQLSPQHQEIVSGLVRSLAEQEGIRVVYDGAMIGAPSEAINLWLSDLELRGTASVTIKSYKQKVESLLSAYPIPTELDIKNFLADKLHEGIDIHDSDAIERRKGTISNYIKAFRSFFRYLYEQGLWNANPASKLKLPRLARREKRAPSEEDIDRLIAQDMSIEDRLFVQLFIDSAIRLEELATIRTRNIDLQKRRILIMGKGRKERFVPISVSTLNLIRQYLSSFDPIPEYLFPAKRADNKTGHTNRRAFGRRLELLCKYAGIPHISPHELRHFVVNFLAERGADIKQISELLGHADVVVTLQVYRHVGSKQVFTMHDRLGVFANAPLQLEGKKS